jgi:gas vesicle protein
MSKKKGFLFGAIASGVAAAGATLFVTKTEKGKKVAEKTNEKGKKIAKKAKEEGKVVASKVKKEAKKRLKK